MLGGKMKTNIIKNELNFENLDMLIRTKEFKEDEDAILFMSRDTCDELYNQLACHYSFKTEPRNIFKESKGYMGKYAGRKIFEDNELKFGEVDIR